MAIWTWAPATITENSEQFAEIITVSDSGYEKRRIKASRPIWSGVFNYYNQHRTERYDMSAFLRARSGPHEWFYLPSFMWDASISTAYSSGTSIIVDDNSRIIDSYLYGRTYIWLQNTSGENEVATITGSSGSTIITISAGLTYDYSIGCEVDICYKARLAETAFVFQDNSYFKHDISIAFKEVK